MDLCKRTAQFASVTLLLVSHPPEINYPVLKREFCSYQNRSSMYTYCVYMYKKYVYMFMFMFMSIC